MRNQNKSNTRFLDPTDEDIAKENLEKDREFSKLKIYR